TFAGLVSGTGALRQIGGGTTTLTADNTYGGGTTISAGTLQLGNGGTSGSIAGDVLDNAALAFDRSDTLTFAGIVSGTGALTQIGTGTTILTGANSYSGGTTISAGALQIGNGGTSGSIVGNVLDNASLVFDRSDSVTAPGAITGSGSLTQLGSGTTILTGANSYAGGTTISAGTLQLGSGGSSGSIGGDVTDNGTLAFDRSNNFTFAGIISGSGGVHQFGSGTTTLSATNTYNGATVIDNGMLLLAGSIASSSVSVNSGGIFAGSGNLAGLSVNSGGTVSPGNGGVGTLNVGGNLTMAANSTYIYDVSPASNDLLQVTGTASLNGTLVINPTGIAPGSAVYHVVDSGGLSGTFTAVTLAPGSPLTLLPELTYGPNDATLQFLVTVSSVLTGGGPLTIGNGNNGDVAGAIDFAIAYDGANVFLPLASLTPTDLAAVLEQMTGEVNVGLKSVALRSTSSFLETMLDPTVGARTNLGSGAFAMAAADMSAVRLAANGASDAGTGNHSGPQFTAWAAATGEQDSGDGDFKLGTHKTTATEFSGEFGLDYAFSPGGAAGVAVGFGNDDWDLDTDLGNGNASFYQLGAYFSERFAKNFYFDAAYTYAHFNVTTDREVDFQGVNKYRADFNTTSQAARFEFGHIFTIERGQALSPYIRFQATDISTPNYEEVTTAGSSAYALAFTRNRHFDYTTELGAAWDDVLSSGSDSFTGLRARLGWLHDFGNTLSDTATFSAFNGASFKVYGVSPAANAAHLMVGIEHDIGPVALSLNTEETFAGDAQSYGGTASIAVRW
ncbi:MAG: autotransporter domain-containing protein, partial [Planctomycetes bacterium]|nr:autotransporter domain-containing protein [Planctomycetota bacterium]